MGILTVSLSDLLADPRNPRSHPKENIEAIKASLSRFGQVLPVLVRDTDCQIIAGNGTVQAMQELGWTECKVAIYDGNDQECRALSVALNRTGELAVWDEANLAQVVGELQAAGFEGMEALGFGEQALGDLVEQFRHVVLDVNHASTTNGKEICIQNMSDGLDQECPRCKFRFASSCSR